MSEFKKGDRVTFRAGARSTSDTVATVQGHTTPGANGSFLITKDDQGVERKVRPGAARKAA